ncbi:PREDICTED: spindle assembly abnormal protein 6-like [Nicotiana attenuata]|uniref:spindle assembly abnormal protein 6-like n=1 Tax=Nicotiana attenuata TaxID=49451 RepID=UPI00090520CE|nr:PREDICTED: spindle assembly abnormal protein 6-like [Nicotiana attenuata]
MIFFLLASAIADFQAVLSPFGQPLNSAAVFIAVLLLFLLILLLYFYYYATQAVVLYREAFTKSQAKLNRCEADLKKLSKERDTLKCLYVKKEEEIRDLRADLAQDRKEEAELDEQLQQKLERIELLRGEVDQIKADCDRWKENMDRLAAEKEATLAKLSSAEVELWGVKEKSSAQAKRIEELEAELAEAKAEVEKTKITAEKSIAVYLADAEAAQTQLREASNRERRSNDLAKCQSRRETLEEIHARGYDLSKEIAQAKALEADARLLISSDDGDDDEGSQGGSDNDEGPEGEAAPEGETSPGHS